MSARQQQPLDAPQPEPRPLRSVPTGELPTDGPQTLGEALSLVASLQAQLGELERQRDELNRKYLGALSQIGNLRADKVAEAQAHKLWGLAVALFTEWKIATGHMKSRWSADRFWICQPYLQPPPEGDGFTLCRFAVWGIAAHPNRKQVTKTHWEVYDSFELVFKTRAHFERYANRGKAIFGKELPQGPPYERQGVR